MSKHILVIDDERDIRRVMQVSLEKFARWRTTLADSAQAGLARAKAEHPDAILLDVSMPEMDGIACFKALSADPDTQSIPVILLTAKVLPSDRQAFTDLGVIGLIAKPFDPMTVWQEVQQILGWP